MDSFSGYRWKCHSRDGGNLHAIFRCLILLADIRIEAFLGTRTSRQHSFLGTQWILFIEKIKPTWILLFTFVAELSRQF